MLGCQSFLLLDRNVPSKEKYPYLSTRSVSDIHHCKSIDELTSFDGTLEELSQLVTALLVTYGPDALIENVSRYECSAFYVSTAKNAEFMEQKYADAEAIRRASTEKRELKQLALLQAKYKDRK